MPKVLAPSPRYEVWGAPIVFHISSSGNFGCRLARKSDARDGTVPHFRKFCAADV